MKVFISPFSQGGSIPDPVAGNIMVWKALFACKVIHVRGYRVGGTVATINARKGSSNHLSSNLSLTSENMWMDGGSVQNTDYNIGDTLEIMIVSVSDAPTQVAIQVEFMRR